MSYHNSGRSPHMDTVLHVRQSYDLRFDSGINSSTGVSGSVVVLVVVVAAAAAATASADDTNNSSDCSTQKVAL